MSYIASEYFKTNIKDMGEDSLALMELRPVTFIYKNDQDKVKRYGLIAEEVAETTLKDLVLYDEKHQPVGLQYHELPVLLLNEIKNQYKVLIRQEKTIQKLEDRIKALEDEFSHYNQYKN